MLVNKAVQLAILAAAAMLWETRTEAATSAFKLCGRKLSDIMSRVCHVYNSPSWDVPTVVEQAAGAARRKRQVGIADECCTYGCTWEQLSEYCSIAAANPLVDGLDSHMIADRSAEKDNVPSVIAAPRVVGERGEAASGRGGKRREVGRGRAGYGRSRRGRRCWCRRKRRSGRRRAALMGNMAFIRNAVRAAPVVGTVSPLLTWGRTLNTDLPPVERDRYAYVAVYST